MNGFDSYVVDVETADEGHKFVPVFKRDIPLCHVNT